MLARAHAHSQSNNPSLQCSLAWRKKKSGGPAHAKENKDISANSITGSSHIALHHFTNWQFTVSPEHFNKHFTISPTALGSSQ
jgi:hypothetical protein